MAKEENLKPFKKGNQAAKGHGRPRGKSLTKILEEAIEKELTFKNRENGQSETKTTAEWLVASLIRDALKGDNIARNQILDRLEGKPIQRQEVSGPDGGPLNQVNYTVETARARLKEIIEN